MSPTIVEARPETAPAEPAAARAREWLRGDRRVIGLLWLALLVECAAFALLQPVWSRVDEAQHYDYVQYLAENRSLPVEGQTFISPDVISVSLATGQWGWREAGQLSAPANLDPATWIPLPKGLDDQQREKWVRRNLWQFNYEAMQPPLYYLINLPVYAVSPADPFIKLYSMRLLAALLAATMLPLTYLTAKEAFPDSRLVVLGAPVVMLLTQGYALNMTQVSNDVIAVPLAAAGVLLLLRMVSRGLSWKLSLAAGVIIGAALLAKLTTIFLAPLAAAAIGLMLVYRRATLRSALRHAALIFAPMVLLPAPWLLHNLFVYGDATGASAARPLMSSFFGSPLTSMTNMRLNELLPTYWFGEPVFPFEFWGWAWIAVGVAMVVGLIGVLYYLHDRQHWQVSDVHIRIIFMIMALVIGFGANLLLPFGSGIGGIPGRYLYPVLPAVAFLLIFGIDRLLRRERARFLAEAMLLWMIVWESFNFLAYIQNR